MGYLQDFQNGVYLLSDPLGSDPLGTELMRRRATRLRSTLKARLALRKQCWTYAGKAKWNS
jgi:hypothetical protein